MKMRIKKQSYKERLNIFSTKCKQPKSSKGLSVDDLHQSVSESRKVFDEELVLTNTHLETVFGANQASVVQENVLQLSLFEDENNEMSKNTQTQDVLDQYMKQLNLAFDTHSLDGLPSMLALEGGDPNDTLNNTLGLRFLEPASTEMKNLMKEFKSLLQNNTIDNVLDKLEENTQGAGQIVIDRSDIITRVLKSRSEDPSSVVVPSPKRLQ